MGLGQKDLLKRYHSFLIRWRVLKIEIAVLISFTFQRPSDSGKKRAFSVTSGERRSLKYALDMGEHRDDPCRCMVSK